MNETKSIFFKIRGGQRSSEVVLGSHDKVRPGHVTRATFGLILLFLPVEKKPNGKQTDFFLLN